jgi:hypothetical protein
MNKKYNKENELTFDRKAIMPSYALEENPN